MGNETLRELFIMAENALEKKGWTIIQLGATYWLHGSIKMKLKLCKYNPKSDITAQVYCNNKMAMLKWSINKGHFVSPRTLLHLVIRKDETKLIYINGRI